MTTTTWDRYEFQAYLAVNPTQPKWCRVTIETINGYEKFKNDPQRVKSGVNGTFMYSDSLAFEDKDAAKAALDHFMTLPQKYDLRINHTVTMRSEEAVVTGTTKKAKKMRVAA